MSVKEIKENLSRAKSYAQRQDTERAVGALINALRLLGTKALASDLRPVMRETVQNLGRNPTIKEIWPHPLNYQPGQEAQLLAPFAQIYKTLCQEEEEGRDAAKSRKLRIDQTLNAGIKLLQQKRVSEADACFAEAVKNYKDEHALFGMIGKALMEVNEFRRAYPYLKRGAEVAPQNANVQALYKQCCELRAKG